MSGETSGQDPGPVFTEDEYRAALEQVAHGWGSSSNPDDAWLDELMGRIEAYEASFGPEGPPPDPALSEADVERLRADLTDVAGWLICRYPGLVDGVVVYRHQGQPRGELAAVVTSHSPEADGRSIGAEAEAALQAMGYVMAPDWRRLSRELHSPMATEISQHRRLQGYDRVEQVLRAS